MNYAFNLLYNYRGPISVLVSLPLSYLLYTYNFKNQINNKKYILTGIDNKVKTTIVSKKKISDDTILLKLKLPEKGELGLPIGHHIRIYGKDDDNEEIFRSYTPISFVNQENYLNLLIKVYFPSEQFPKGGALTQYLNNLNINDNIDISGPLGRLEYKEKGNFYFNVHKKTKKYNKISLIGGGSGITPLYQLMIHLLRESYIKNISLLYANKSESDILLKDNLQRLDNSGLIKLKLSIDSDKDSTNWDGYVGYVQKEWLKESIYPASNDNLVCLCGPPIMNKMVKKYLLELGYSEENIFMF